MAPSSTRPERIPIPDRVQAGVELLNRESLGWQDEIDIDGLDLQSGSSCVLGQIFGDYRSALDRLAISPAEYGFVCAKGEPDFEECVCDSLTAAWRNRIEAMRAASPKAVTHA